jgi:hypothetical protein
LSVPDHWAPRTIFKRSDFIVVIDSLKLIHAIIAFTRRNPSPQSTFVNTKVISHAFSIIDSVRTIIIVYYRVDLDLKRVFTNLFAPRFGPETSITRVVCSNLEAIVNSFLYWNFKKGPLKFLPLFILWFNRLKLWLNSLITLFLTISESDKDIISAINVREVYGMMLTPV